MGLNPLLAFLEPGERAAGVSRGTQACFEPDLALCPAWQIPGMGFSGCLALLGSVHPRRGALGRPRTLGSGLGGGRGGRLYPGGGCRSRAPVGMQAGALGAGNDWASSVAPSRHAAALGGHAPTSRAAPTFSIPKRTKGGPTVLQSNPLNPPSCAANVPTPPSPAPGGLTAPTGLIQALTRSEPPALESSGSWNGGVPGPASACRSRHLPRCLGGQVRPAEAGVCPGLGLALLFQTCQHKRGLGGRRGLPAAR